MSLKYSFRCGCPCCDDNSNSLIKWRHRDCGGYSFIGEKGFVECENCKKSFGLENVHFNCGSHEFSFRSYPLKNTHILNILTYMAEEINDEKFISHIMSSVFKRIEDY